MISNSTLNRLKELGLNSYEARIWTALLMKGTATAGILSEIANVPRSRCYDVLETLEKKGFIITKLGRPITYLAVSPEDAVDRVKVNLKDIAAEKISLLEEVKKSDFLIELNNLHLQSSNSLKAEDLTGVIKTKKNIDNHIISMVKSSKQEILLAMETIDLKEKSGLLQTLISSLNSKPRIRILTNADNPSISKLKEFAEVKITSNCGRFCLTENGVTMFLTQNTDSDNESALWINASPVVENLKSLFESKWTNA